MGRNTDDRSIAGHRHEIRQPTDEEVRRIVELQHQIVRAHNEADDYIVDLYEAHVSQAAIARVLGVTQGAVHLRVRRRRERAKERRESGVEQAWFSPRALTTRVARLPSDRGTK